jgi:hypothetical protein
MNSYELLAICLIFLGNCALFYLGLMFYRTKRAIKREKQKFLSNFNTFITPDGENPSPLEQMIIGLSKNIGSQTAQSIRAQLQQAASVDARNMNKLEKQATHAALGAKSPWLGMFAPKIMEWLGVKEKDVLPMILNQMKPAEPVKPSSNHEEEEVYEYPS